MYKLKEKIGGVSGGKFSFNPLGGIPGVDWVKPEKDLEKISPPVGKESGRSRKMFRSQTRAQEVLRLIGGMFSHGDQPMRVGIFKS